MAVRNRRVQDLEYEHSFSDSRPSHTSQTEEDHHQSAETQTELKNIWLQLKFVPKFNPRCLATVGVETEVDGAGWRKLEASWEKYMNLKRKVRYG